jgi:DNA-binding CsgD family transcriptional regulator
MVWLDEADLHAARNLRRTLDRADAPAGLTRAALEELVRLVPSDASGWSRITLTTGAVEHDPHRSPSHYEISISVRPVRTEAVVFGLGRDERRFSVRDEDVLSLARPAVEQALQLADARERLVRALASAPPPGTAVVLLNRYGEIEQSSVEAERWLAEHFGPAEHPGWLPEPVASWLALPPRPPLQSVRDGRLLTVHLLPGDPHALLLEEDVASFRADALDQLGLTAREREVLGAARAMPGEAQIADELYLSLHAVRERLERLEEKLSVHTPAEAIAAALRASI